MSVLHVAINPHFIERPNLGALMIAHFRKQGKQSSGAIRVSGLITHIASRFHINLVESREVRSGPTRLTRAMMITYRFLRPDVVMEGIILISAS